MEASRCCGWEVMADFAARRRGVESIVGEDEEMEEGEDWELKETSSRKECGTREI